MKVYRDLSEFKTLRKAIVTTGTFDGVHLGHQIILKRLCEIAEREGGETVLFTFDPHPRQILFPDDNDLKLLNTLEEKIERLEKAGIEHLIIQPFTLAFSRITAVDYVKKILVDQIGVYRLVIGYDHHFGRNREGSFENLKVLAPQHGFEVEEIPAQEIDEVNISSTKIRNALLAGDVATANTYLKYIYPLSGIVVKGRQIGRNMGFPTANIKVDNITKLIPADGVYAVRIIVNNNNFKGMLSIGWNPTIVNEPPSHSIEVNIFDFDDDIYGKEITVLFVKRIRDEEKFDDINSLKEQLENDRIECLQYLA